MPNGFTAGTKQPSYPCPRPQFEFQESRSLLSQKAVSLEFRATSTMSIAEVIKKQTNRDTCKNYIYICMYVCICVDQLGRPCHILSFGLPGPYVDGFKKDREVIYIYIFIYTSYKVFTTQRSAYVKDRLSLVDGTSV